jgi:hypothetical protein
MIEFPQRAYGVCGFARQGGGDFGMSQVE